MTILNPGDLADTAGGLYLDRVNKAIWAFMPGAAPGVAGYWANLATSGETFNVMHYGATGNGVTDDSAAVQATINAAQTVGGIVFFPSGTYFINPGGSGGAALNVTAPCMFWGAGQKNTTLLLGNATMDLLAVSGTGSASGTADYFELQDLTLDVKTHNAQAAIVHVANYGHYQRFTVLGGSNIFAIYLAGPSGATQAAPLYNVGNVMEKLNLTDGYNGDGFSWSFQAQSSVRDVVHNGSRISLYICETTTVDKYDFTPGSQGSANGFYITPPAQTIRIRNFTYNVNSNVGVGPSIGITAGDPTYNSTDIAIERFAVLDPGGLNKAPALIVGDVQNYRLTDSFLATNASIALENQRSSQADIVFTNSQLAQIAFSQGAAVASHCRAVSCYFPTFTPAAGQNSHILVNFNNATCHCDILGGEFVNTNVFGTNTGGQDIVIRDVRGFNPTGTQSVGVPGSGSATTALQFDATFYVTANASGTTTVAISGGPTITLPGSACVPVFVPAGKTLTPSYTNAPTWVVEGQ